MSRNPWLLIIIAMAILLAGAVNLEKSPRLWWDEGWTLAVAHNWVAQGHYGQINAGERHSAGLSAAFPVVAPIALSFKLLGVGIWQGRLPGLLLTFGALGLMYYLARQIYHQRVAVGTLGVLLLMTVGPTLHPIIVGRQVLGELPAMFYLLAGYALLYLALSKSTWMILPAAALWGIALKTKAQVAPFWMVAMTFTLGAVLLKGWWKAAIVLLIGSVGGWLAGIGVARIPGLLFENIIPGGPVEGIYEVTAKVPDLQMREQAWLIAFTVGLPTLLGLAFAGIRILLDLRNIKADQAAETLKIALFALAGSWFTWYVLLAMFFVRYLFPAVFLGSVFAAAFLHEISGGYSIRTTFKTASQLIFKRKINRSTTGGLGAILLIAMVVPLNLVFLYSTYTDARGASFAKVVNFLENETAADAIIETYESELFFRVDRTFHYPPDYVHVALIRRAYLDADRVVEYDPLVVDPDYLVTGNFSESFQLYDQVLATEEFRLIYEVPGYRIFIRDGKTS